MSSSAAYNSLPRVNDRTVQPWFPTCFPHTTYHWPLYHVPASILANGFLLSGHYRSERQQPYLVPSLFACHGPGGSIQLNVSEVVGVVYVYVDLLGSPGSFQLFSPRCKPCQISTRTRNKTRNRETQRKDRKNKKMCACVRVCVCV